MCPSFLFADLMEVAQARRRRMAFLRRVNTSHAFHQQLRYWQKDTRFFVMRMARQGPSQPWVPTENPSPNASLFFRSRGAVAPAAFPSLIGTHSTPTSEP
jgi:hypothetical protein